MAQHSDRPAKRTAADVATDDAPPAQRPAAAHQPAHPLLRLLASQPELLLLPLADQPADLSRLARTCHQAFRIVMRSAAAWTEACVRQRAYVPSAWYPTARVVTAGMRLTAVQAQSYLRSDREFRRGLPSFKWSLQLPHTDLYPTNTALLLPLGYSLEHTQLALRAPSTQLAEPIVADLSVVFPLSDDRWLAVTNEPNDTSLLVLSCTASPQHGISAQPIATLKLTQFSVTGLAVLPLPDHHLAAKMPVYTAVTLSAEVLVFTVSSENEFTILSQFQSPFSNLEALHSLVSPSATEVLYLLSTQGHFNIMRASGEIIAKAEWPPQVQHGTVRGVLRPDGKTAALFRTSSFSTQTIVLHVSLTDGSVAQLAAFSAAWVQPVVDEGRPLAVCFDDGRFALFDPFAPTPGARYLYRSELPRSVHWRNTYYRVRGRFFIAATSRAIALIDWVGGTMVHVTLAASHKPDFAYVSVTPDGRALCYSTGFDRVHVHVFV